tara:strand:+ start:464 stop:646 length:183 start_codon:yes stop_codon:yes gene_type:complete
MLWNRLFKIFKEIVMSLNVGDSAPDFLLKTGFTEEDAIVLNDYKNKTLVLAFFPLAFTGG